MEAFGISMAVNAERVIIVADGTVDIGLLASLGAGGDTQERPRLLAADGGAAKVLQAGLVPDLVIGDGDSLTAQGRAHLERLGVELRLADPDKDESDTELCLMAALAGGARRISLLGAFGEVRPEHTVANLLLLADQRFDGLDIEILGQGARLVRIGTRAGPGSIDIDGAPRDHVSLFPLGSAVEGVTTWGLRFPLTDATLELGRTRGLSNELLDGNARVTSERGCLLVVHTGRPAASADDSNGG